MKIGFQSMVINPTTPQKPIGHLLETNNLSLVKGDCMIRCFYVEEEVPMLFVTMDVFAVSSLVIDKMKDIAESHYRKSVELIVTATHTHSAPSLFNGFNTFHQNSNYIEYVLERFEICLIKLKTSMVDCHLDYNVSDIELEPFRHDIHGVTRLQLLSFFDASKPIGHWIFFNAHPTLVAADAHYFSSDYIGSLLEKLQQKYPFEFFMFFQGSCGDVHYQNLLNKSTYQDSVKVSNVLFNHIVKHINQKNIPKPSNFELHDINVSLSHKVKTIKVFDHSDEQTLNHAKELLPKMKLIKESLPKKVDFKHLVTSQCSIVFTPFEWHSSYQRQLDDSLILVNFSNGYYGNITQHDSSSLSFESIFETITTTEKEKLVNKLKQL